MWGDIAAPLKTPATIAHSPSQMVRAVNVAIGEARVAATLAALVLEVFVVFPILPFRVLRTSPLRASVWSANPVPGLVANVFGRRPPRVARHAFQLPFSRV